VYQQHTVRKGTNLFGRQAIFPRILNFVTLFSIGVALLFKLTAHEIAYCSNNKLFRLNYQHCLFKERDED